MKKEKEATLYLEGSEQIFKEQAKEDFSNNALAEALAKLKLK